jgi:putative methyltransferase (TIGR04325 family)
MSLRQWVQRLAPPILTDLYRSTRRGGRSSGQVWQGIYSGYGDVPTWGAGFDSGRFVSDAVAQAEKLLAASKRSGSIPTEVSAEHSLLPLLVSLICKSSGGAKVLDFGGGLGAAYLHLVSSVLGCGVVDYHLVERGAVCVAATRFFQGDSHVQCHASLPEDLPGLDVVHVSSVLQYIEDYAGLLRKLCAYRAKYILFVKLSSGDIPTYATQQTNVPGTTLAYWFINIREVIALMSQGGYALIFKGALEREYDQRNFPSEYRLGRACNLLFART